MLSGWKICGRTKINGGFSLNRNVQPVLRYKIFKEHCKKCEHHDISLSKAKKYANWYISCKLLVWLEPSRSSFFFNSPFQGRGVSCETPQVMPHCTSGSSLRWFHHRLVGIVGTLCGWRTLSTFAKGRTKWPSQSSRDRDLNRRPPARSP